MPFHLHLDLDGVLADFDAGLRAQGFSPDPALNRASHLLPDSLQEAKRRMRQIILRPGFYRNLPPMDGFDALVDAARAYPTVLVLTSVPGRATPEQAARAAAEKAAWVAEHLPWIPSDRFRWTHGSHGKAAHVARARPHAALLLDDRADNCRAWDEAGGASIHHVDPARSVSLLLHYLKG
jgi:5'(3')-deoxyribonucleotidase